MWSITILYDAVSVVCFHHRLKRQITILLEHGDIVLMIAFRIRHGTHCQCFVIHWVLVHHSFVIGNRSVWNEMHCILYVSVDVFRLLLLTDSDSVINTLSRFEGDNALSIAIHFTVFANEGVIDKPH